MPDPITPELLTGWLYEYFEQPDIKVKWGEFYFGTNAPWTKFFVKGESGYKSIGQFLQDKISPIYEEQDWKHEYDHVDVALGMQFRFEDVKEYNTGNPQRKDSPHYISTYADILLELENQPELCYQEMIKLARMKSHIKWLITYLVNLQDNQVPAKRALLEENFRAIVRNMNQAIPEPGGTAYILSLIRGVEGKPVPEIYHTVFTTALTAGQIHP